MATIQCGAYALCHRVLEGKLFIPLTIYHVIYYIIIVRY